ncbi:MAG: hypothetical protein SGJ18_13640 [Pseudomonadota bacterium]|nr:hypothetical protein [Pseudomonadota bacterium]
MWKYPKIGKMVRTFFLLLFVGLVVKAPLNLWADGIAESQVGAKNRYKGFIDKVKEGAADDKLDVFEIKRIKAQRAQSQELKEKSRREYIANREVRRKRELTSEMRDQFLEEQIKKEKQSLEVARRFFLRQRELIKKALKSVPQVDPHDEYEVGKHYEDESGEVEVEGEAEAE